MDMIAPLVKTGVVSAAANLWLAVPIGFIFGLGLYFAGFTDSRRIAHAFYLKDVGVPVVMFSAIVTGMVGLWLLMLIGVIDGSKMYFLPTYLLPMAVGGLLFGIGMAIGGFCPGTAAASVATGRIDAMVFVVGFLGGSILFGDLFPIWGDFYNSDYRGVYRLDQLLGVNLGTAVLLLVIASVGGSLLMRLGQHHFWPSPREERAGMRRALRYEAPVVVLTVVVATAMALFPTDSFLEPRPAPWFVIQKADAPPASPARSAPLDASPAGAAPKRAQGGAEGC